MIIMHLVVNNPSDTYMMDGLSLDCPMLILAFLRAPPFAFSRIAVTDVVATGRVDSSPLKLVPLAGPTAAECP